MPQSLTRPLSAIFAAYVVIALWLSTLAPAAV